MRSALLEGVNRGDLAAIAGSLTLEVTELDLNGDGIPDKLYRMSPLYRSTYSRVQDDGTRVAHLTGFHTHSHPICRALGFPGQTSRHFYYFVPTLAPNLFVSLVFGQAQTNHELFFWRGQRHVLTDFGNDYSAIVGSGDTSPAAACVFNLIKNGKYFIRWAG